MTEQPIQATVRAQVAWEEVDRVPVLAANQFLVQVSPAEPGTSPSDVLLSIGYLSPPVFVGTPEEQRAAAEALEQISVRPIARFVVPASRATELAGILQRVITQIEATGGQR